MYGNIEDHLDILDKRRHRLDDKWLARRERQEKDAAPFIGELMRDGEVVFYVNVLSLKGTPTGRTVEFERHFEAVDYLVRNKYV